MYRSGSFQRSRLIPCDLSVPKAVVVKKVATRHFTFPLTCVGKRQWKTHFLIDESFESVFVKDNHTRYAVAPGVVYALAAQPVPGRVGARLP